MKCKMCDIDFIPKPKQKFCSSQCKKRFEHGKRLIANNMEAIGLINRDSIIRAERAAGGE